MKEFEQLVRDRYWNDKDIEGMEGLLQLKKVNSLVSQQVIENIDKIDKVIGNGNLIEFEKEFTKLIEKYS
jgi:hypothetical protein